jgi:hypothetical protein
MAWVFSLSAECGPKQEAAELFAKHFADILWVLSNGGQSRCHAAIFQDMDDQWWCRVCPSDVSQTGIESPDSAYTMTELGILLYQRLRSAPAFQYALVGVEVDEFRTHRELISESDHLNIPGLVLSHETWQKLASKSDMIPFKLGYVWYPYEGEAYKPLMTSSVLKEQMNRLLAA